MVSARLPHKTEAGAVKLGLRSAPEVAAAAQRMTRRRDGLRRGTSPIASWSRRWWPRRWRNSWSSIRRDPQFGLAMTLAAGGVLVELLADATTLLLPASRADLARALARLRINRLLDGYRGKPAASREALLDTLERLAAFAADSANDVAEIEINPLFVGTTRELRRRRADAARLAHNEGVGERLIRGVDPHRLRAQCSRRSPGSRFRGHSPDFLKPPNSAMGETTR